MADGCCKSSRLVFLDVIRFPPVGGRRGGRELKMEGLLEVKMLPRKDEEVTNEAGRGPGLSAHCCCCCVRSLCWRQCSGTCCCCWTG